MKKLQLNKRTVAQMDRMQMRNVKGGINLGIRFDWPCVASCPGVGSLKGKLCCRRHN